MRIGIGLGTAVILGMLLNLLHIPIDWKIFLVISLILPAYDLILKRKTPNFKFKLTKSNISILIVLLLFCGTLFMYASGAFSYPYLEDDDPWNYAKGVKYIALEKTAFEPEGFDSDLFKYVDPYPAGYSIIMAVLHQTSDSISWTLKFFTSLIISLSLIFFYFFIKSFTKDYKKALFSTFVLAAVPCTLWHFIWSLSLIVPLFIVMMYCLLQIKNDSKWIIPSTILFGSLALVHPQMVINMGIMFILYVVIKGLFEKKIPKKELAVGVLAVLLSLIWWAPMFMHYGSPLAENNEWGEISRPFSIEKPEGKWIYYKGSADRVYTFDDFVWAKKDNMINNPIGIGLVISILVALSIIFFILAPKKLLKKENKWLVITIAWFLFTLFGVLGASLPIQFTAFRFWMIFALPVSILAMVGTWFLLSLGKKLKLSVLIILIVVILGIFATSAYQKYSFNTATWPPGVKWSSYDEVYGYSWLKTLPADTKVFGLCGKSSAQHIIGFDAFDCIWCKDISEFRQKAFNKTPEEVSSFVKLQDYQYLIIDSRCINDYGTNETNAKVEELVSSNLFLPVQQAPGVIIFQVK